MRILVADVEQLKPTARVGRWGAGGKRENRSKYKSVPSIAEVDRFHGAAAVVAVVDFRVAVVEAAPAVDVGARQHRVDRFGIIAGCDARGVVDVVPEVVNGHARMGRTSDYKHQSAPDQHAHFNSRRRALKLTARVGRWGAGGKRENRSKCKRDADVAVPEARIKPHAVDGGVVWADGDLVLRRVHEFVALTEVVSLRRLVEDL